MVMFWPGELDYLSEQQVDTMLDLCQHQSRIVLQSSTGSEKVTYAPQLVYPCGLDTTSSIELIRGTDAGAGFTLITDAKLRLPLGVPVKPEDRIVILRMYQRWLARQILYYIVSEPISGPSAITCDLKEIII